MRICGSVVMNTRTMRSVLIGFEYPCGTLRIIFAQNPIWQSAPGVADGYSFSRSHGDLRKRDFPAVKDGESADAVIIDGDVLGGNAVLLFSVVHTDMANRLRYHAHPRPDVFWC